MFRKESGEKPFEFECNKARSKDSAPPLSNLIKTERYLRRPKMSSSCILQGWSSQNLSNFKIQ